MSFWEIWWWSNSLALKRYSISCRSLWEGIFFIFEISYFTQLNLRGDNLPKMLVGSSKSRLPCLSEHVFGISEAPLFCFFLWGLPICKLFFLHLLLKKHFLIFFDVMERFSFHRKEIELSKSRTTDPCLALFSAQALFTQGAPRYFPYFPILPTSPQHYSSPVLSIQTSCYFLSSDSAQDILDGEYF